MKYSIIIPTYNKCDELLKPCIESIIKYTSLVGEFAELIVVANGCTDNTVQYLTETKAKYPKNLRFASFPEAVGYTKAINLGIGTAKGDYIIPLNNDTILLDNPVNNWLEILNKPFRDDEKVAITGPMMVPNDGTGLPFLIFFCVMLSKKAIDKVGLLDEIFSPGYGEDTDWCLRAEKLGYKQIQVPVKSERYYADKKMVGNFPIYHAGNQTFKDHQDAELIKRNNQILVDRYSNIRLAEEPEMKIAPLKGVEIPFDTIYSFGDGAYRKNGVPCSMNEVYPMLDLAKKCDGYMADEELEWLGKQAAQHKIIIEVGSWHGKSSRAIGDNLMSDGHLICVDHWRGSKVERDTNHQSANWEDGDHAYLEFLENMWDLVGGKKVSALRLSSKNAAKYLSKHDYKADMIFIDAGHTHEEVKEDILSWLPLLKDDGMICGHDYFHVNNTWVGVRQAVDECFGTQVKQAPNTSIWVVKAPPKVLVPIIDSPKVKRPPCIFDCFPFHNEVDILLERFKTLHATVDRFIIVEAKYTHGGKPKELVFEKHMDKFAPYVNKVTYLVIEEFPKGDSWTRERYQRDYIMNGLTGCQDDDIIIISDCDEIPNPEAIKEYQRTENNTICGFEMDLYYYNEHTKAKDKWKESRITTYNRLKEISPCGVRYYKVHHMIPNGGKHLSYFGGVDAVIKKIEDAPHQEYNTDEFKDRNHVIKAIEEGKDVFKRPEIQFEKV